MRLHVQPRRDGVPEGLGAPRLPGCKSHAQRALLLAALTPGEHLLRGVPDGDDVATLERVLRGAGRDVQVRGEVRRLVGRAVVPGDVWHADVGENGTAARALLMLVPLLGGCLHLDGAPGLRRRPMASAVQALRSLSVACDREALPLIADGRSRVASTNGSWIVDGSVTSQPATGAMLALALLGGGTLRVRAPRALGYLELTAGVLCAFGAAVARREDGRDVLFEVGGVRPPAGDFTVPRDASARAFVAALAAMHRVPLPTNLASTAFASHPDLGIDADLDRLVAAGTDDLHLDDLAKRPDCVPALAAVAATREGLTRFAGLANLRHKESDRLAAMAAGISAAGAAAHVEGDDLVVRGPLRVAHHPPRLPTVPDHRVVMALALLGTALPGGVVLDDTHAVAKSWPSFFAWLGRCADVRPAD